MAGQKREARLRARCPGHPRLGAAEEDVDARDKPGHDEVKENPEITDKKHGRQ
jgi:hypothetical protein